jgi:hypothetical protein
MRDFEGHEFDLESDVELDGQETADELESGARRYIRRPAARSHVASPRRRYRPRRALPHSTRRHPRPQACPRGPHGRHGSCPGRPPGRPRYGRPRVLVSSPLPVYGSPLVRRVQECLLKVMGGDVVPSGVIEASTRSAVRAFQRSRDLADTGILDTQTLAELFGACTTGAADAAPGARDVEDSDGEIFGGALADRAVEPELFVADKVEVTLERHGPVPLRSLTGKEAGMQGPGIYVIRLKDKPWYVGLAASRIMSRFQSRFSAIRQLQAIEQGALEGQVEWFSLRSWNKAPVRRGNRTRKRPLSGNEAPLRLVEQLFIERYGTGGSRGNRDREAVRFLGTGSLSVRIVHRGGMIHRLPARTTDITRRGR